MLRHSFIVAVVVVLAGRVAAAEAKRADAYFPLTPGATWTYRVTIKADGAGEPKTAEQVVKVEAGKLEGSAVSVAGETAYAAKEDGVYVVGVTKNGKLEALEEPQKVVPAAPKLGDKWTYREAAGVTAATCLGIEKVKVGAGEYDAAKIYLVTSGGADGSQRREVYRWFAAGVGPVKGTVTDRRTKGDGTVGVNEIALELTSFEAKGAGGEVKAAAGKETVAELFAEGEALAKKGEHRAALAKYDAALAMDPKAAKVHAYRAISLISTRQFEAAEKAIGEAIRLDAKEYTFAEIAGQLKLAQGRIAEGKALYEKAATMSPGNAGAVYTDLAAVLGARKDERLNGEILAALERAAGATPPSAEALFALGQTYVNAGRAEGAKYLQRYLEVVSKLPEGKRDEAKVRLAKQMIRAVEAVKQP
jgi:tetratricopeptide (TPR) repeat protein